MSRLLFIAVGAGNLCAATLLSLSLAACSGGGGESESFHWIPPEGFPRPMQGSDTLTFVAVAAGTHHSCGLEANGTAWCWGSDEYGQLGSDSPMQSCSDGQIPCTGTPLRVVGNQQLVSLSASIRHTCGIDAHGQAWCWGFGEGGQLGDGLRQDSVAPVRVAGDHVYIELSASVSGYATCAVTTSGAAWCWGPDTDGVLGNGTREGSAEPVQVASDRRFVDISVGQLHAYAVTTEGDAYCW